MEFIRELLISESMKDYNYETYHTTYSSAIQEALGVVRERGYEIDDDEVFRKIGSGPRKPQPGDTNSITLELSRDGRPVRKALHIQVYNRGNETDSPFELNMYIL